MIRTTATTAYRYGQARVGIVDRSHVSSWCPDLAGAVLPRPGAHPQDDCGGPLVRSLAPRSGD